MSKVWKGYGLTNYMVSNEGDIMNKRTSRVLSPRDVKGRHAVTLRINGESVQFLVHTLVCIVFRQLDKDDLTRVVKHKDGNYHNNHLDNLEIITCRKRNIDSNRKAKTSKYTGVSFNKHAKKWAAYISIKSKRRLLGYFDNEELANDAYQEALLEA